MEKLKINIVNGLMYTDIGAWNANKHKYCDMSVLVDTGAAITTIPDSILKGLGCLTYNKTTKVRTASGIEEMREVIIPKIKLGNVELENIAVHSYHFPYKFDFDGILGMNVLREFNFSVDFDENIIELRNRL